jgi:sec-independent protein translocase protein TatA
MNILGLFQLSPMEILIILGLGVLLFGRKLPDVGRYLGKGIVEFKKGLKGLEDEADTASSMAPRHETPSLEAPRPPQRVVTTAPKFEETPNSVTTQPKA